MFFKFKACFLVIFLNWIWQHLTLKKNSLFSLFCYHTFLSHTCQNTSSDLFLFLSSLFKSCVFKLLWPVVFSYPSNVHDFDSSLNIADPQILILEFSWALVPHHHRPIQMFQCDPKLIFLESKHTFLMHWHSCICYLCH